MKHEFITSRGRLTIERDIIYIQNQKISFNDTMLGIMLYPLAILALFFLKINFVEGSFDLLIGFIWGFVFLGLFFGKIYISFDLIFKRSLADRISLSRIKSFETKPDATGMETDVIFHLKNGRYRKIPFRTLEKQFEPFLDLVSQHITQPQFA